MKANYIGLMSGTSLDGIDTSLICTDGQDKIEFIANHYIEYDKLLRSRIADLIHTANYSEFLSIERDFTAANVTAVKELLATSDYKDSSAVRAIGFHGQTIFHAPKQNISWQLGNGSILAAELGIDTVYDFRRQDIARNGGGAPLVPIFHQALCANKELPAAIINIGGVSNITYIGKNKLTAWDIGPGCALINDICLQHYGKPYDKDGNIASSVEPNDNIISDIMTDEYFKRSSPKCLDRNHFVSYLSKLSHLAPSAQISTLTSLSAKIISQDLLKPEIPPKNVYFCGGGSHNKHLLQLIEKSLPSNICIKSIYDLSPQLDPDFVESTAFAYLAARRIRNLPSTLPTTTGCYMPTICGSLIKH